MQTRRLVLPAALLVVVSVLPLQSEQQTTHATLHGIGDLPGGATASVVRDAVKTGGVIHAVGAGAAIASVGATDTGILWTWDGSTATLSALPNLATGTARVHAGALTPTASYIASQVRANGPSAARVATNSLPIGNVDPDYLTTSDPSGTFRLFDGLASGSPDFLGNRPQAAVAISHDGSVLYGGVRALTRAARFDHSTLSTTLIPLIAGKAANLPAPRGTSADGNVMVGTATTTLATAALSQIYPHHYALPGQLNAHTAFRYDHAAGTSTPIPAPAGNVWSKALAVTTNGALTLVAGNSTRFSNGEIYVHDAAASPAAALTMLGSPNAAWVPTSFGGMTDDGSVVAVTFAETGHFSSGDRYGYFHNPQGWFHLVSALHDAGANISGWSRFQIMGLSSDGTLVFGYGLHNGVTEGFVAEFDAGYLAAYAPQPEPPSDTGIVGVWTDSLSAPATVLAIMADGSYYIIRANGFERGLYRYDAGTVRVITLQDQNGNYGISDSNATPVTVSVAGGELRSPAGCTIGPECEVLQRIEGGAGSVVGGWLLGDATQSDSSAVVVLMAGGTFFMAEDGAADAFGQDGVEIGSYFWNPVTGAFASSLPLEVDTTGDWGLSHMSGQERLGLTADELQLVSIDGVSAIAALRIVDPATVVPVITSVSTAAGTATLPFAYRIEGTRAQSFGLDDAPEWMTVDAVTGAVSGTPSAAGVFTVTVLAVNSFGDSGTATVTVTIEPSNTSAGSGVTVTPDVPPGAQPISLGFSSVTAAGETTVTVIDPQEAPAPPAGFELGGLYYDISTTAEFDGPVQVCFSYAGVDFGPGSPRLFHYESGAWVDITTSVDTVNQVICGATASFSPFAIFVSPIVRVGFHAPVSQTPGFVNVVKAGATVPLKFNVYVNGVEQTDTAGLSFGVWSVGCTGTTAEDPVDFTTSGATSLRYDASAGAFVQTWKTPAVPGCYAVRMTTTADGLSIGATFRLR